MDDYIGDLTDILRASGCYIEGANTTTTEDPVGNRPFQSVPINNYPICDDFQFQLVPNQNNLKFDDFGDRFHHINDPILDEVDKQNTAFFNNSTHSTKTSVVEGTTRAFSPNVGSTPIINNTIKDSPIDVINSTNSSKTSYLENPWGLRVSSTWNTRIKRKNCETKRVVCIRAPLTPTNCSSREQVAPSDQWSWWKNGQKRIRGSPYLRDYYRCGSSRACPARKQVERSRTYPNMLIITYTSDHNHPLPTQRNTFTGSTRFQPSKAETCPKNSSQAQNKALQVTNMKEKIDISTSSTPIISNEPIVKDQRDDLGVQNTPMGLNDNNGLTDMINENQLWDDLFAELGDICHGNDPFTTFLN